MKYRFHRCQPHAKCPDLTGWYLEIKPDDHETLFKVHKGVTGIYYNKFSLDPHIQDDELNSYLYNPIRLAALWLQGIHKFLLNGETVLVNCNGGIVPLVGTTVLETVESDDLDWDVRYDDETITISRWPEGKYYYLCSNKFRIFIPDKYTTYTAAYRVAQRYVPAKRIKSTC
jgi:hypothetical protein